MVFHADKIQGVVEDALNKVSIWYGSYGVRYIYSGASLDLPVLCSSDFGDKVDVTVLNVVSALLCPSRYRFNRSAHRLRPI